MYFHLVYLICSFKQSSLMDIIPTSSITSDYFEQILAFPYQRQEHRSCLPAEFPAPNKPEIRRKSRASGRGRICC